MCFRSVQNEMQEAYFLKQVKAQYDHQKSAHEQERPDNESPQNIMMNRERTYSLRNGWFRRELNQNNIISAILLIFIITYPLKKSVVGIQRHCGQTIHYPLVL